MKSPLACKAGAWVANLFFKNVPEGITVANNTAVMAPLTLYFSATYPVANAGSCPSLRALAFSATYPVANVCSL